MTETTAESNPRMVGIPKSATAVPALPAMVLASLIVLHPFSEDKSPVTQPKAKLLKVI